MARPNKRKATEFFLAGLAVLVVFAVSVVIFGWPTRRIITFLFLSAIGGCCVIYGLILYFVEIINSAKTRYKRPTKSVSTVVPPAPGPASYEPFSSLRIPFCFEHADRRSFIDVKNGLRIAIYGGPNYEDSLLLEPTSGSQAEAWPKSARGYFEFTFRHDRRGERTALRISAAFPYVPFERDYPGRSEELFDAMFPVLCEIYARLSSSPIRYYSPIPDEVRWQLMRGESYM
jgi:hypothetical protein